MSGRNDRNKIFMKIKLEQENKFINFLCEIKISFFYLFYELLKEYDPSLIFECVSVILQYLQLMYYPFDGYVRIFF
jgi:hypothetical protein